jgi:hypothetical protein
MPAPDLIGDLFKILGKAPPVPKGPLQVTVGLKKPPDPDPIAQVLASQPPVAPPAAQSNPMSPGKQFGATPKPLAPPPAAVPQMKPAAQAKPDLNPPPIPKGFAEAKSLSSDLNDQITQGLLTPEAAQKQFDSVAKASGWPAGSWKAPAPTLPGAAPQTLAEAVAALKSKLAGQAPKVIPDDLSKLPDKSPEARASDAARLGYTTPAYKGMSGEAQRVTDIGKTPEGGSFSAADPRLANQYASEGWSKQNQTVLPMLLNTQDYMVYNARGATYAGVNSRVIAEAKAQGAKGVVVLNVLDHPTGKTPVPGHPDLGPQTVYITLDPSTARSKFARFDPAKSSIADLLASGLAYVVPPALGAALLGTDKAEAAEDPLAALIDKATGGAAPGDDPLVAIIDRATAEPLAAPENEPTLRGDIAHEFEQSRQSVQSVHDRETQRRLGILPPRTTGGAAADFLQIVGGLAGMATSPATGAIRSVARASGLPGSMEPNTKPWAEMSPSERARQSARAPFEKRGTEEEQLDRVTNVLSIPVPLVGVTSPGGLAKKVAGSEPVKLLEKIFSPTTVDANAKDAERLIRAGTGLAARDTASTAAAMEPYHRAINALPDTQRLDFIDHIEGGPPKIATLPVELRPLATSMRDAFELRAAKLTSLPSTAAAHFIDDYFPHFWQDPKAAAQFAKGFKGSGIGKQGSGASLKKREIPTIADGIKAGLVPVTTDPIEATMRYVSSMDRFIATTATLDVGKMVGLVKYIKPKTYGASGHPDSFKVPDGWVPLNGRGARNAAGGQAYAPEGFANVYNNFISRGFHANAEAGRVYDAVQKTSNAITALELGLSAYHASTMAGEAAISRFSTALKDVYGGARKGDVMRLLRGGRELAINVATGPTTFGVAPATRSYRKGAQLEKVYLGQNPGASADMHRVVDLLEKAGGRAVSARHASDYRFSAEGSYWKAFQQGALKMQMQTAAADIKAHPIVGTARQTATAIGRIMSTISAPLFETVIPRLKNGAFYEAMDAWLRANPAATYDVQVAEARKLWDSIDNRFGELVDDNIFWNNTLKQSAKLGMRSYSWNLGTVREIGGGVRDVARGGGAEPKEISQKAAYIIALPMYMGMTNAVYQYLKTGKVPESVQDLIGGQTGGEQSLSIPSTKPYARSAKSTVPERVQIPGYQKDVMGWYENWEQEALNKRSKLLSMGMELASNRDWRGDPIFNPEDSAPEWLKQFFAYAGQSMIPISMQGIVKGRKEGSNIGRVEQSMGLRSSPPYVADPEGYARQQRNIHVLSQKKKERYDKKQERIYGGTE